MAGYNRVRIDAARVHALFSGCGLDKGTTILIETFIAGINDVDDVMSEWRNFITQEKERQLDEIIQEERLKPEETRKFIENALRDGEIKTTGSGVDKLLPPMGRFSGGGNRAEKKKTVIERLKAFLERFLGVGL